MRKFAIPIAMVAIIALVFALSIDSVRAFLFALIIRVLFLIKSKISLFIGSFLVKGKFVLFVFLKKVGIISTIELTKRYVIEKIIVKTLKNHFLNHIKDDIKRLYTHFYGKFIGFTIVKRLIVLFTFLSSVTLIGRFFGLFLTLKVLLAKVWSFMLMVVLKISAFVSYFFTDLLWNSWLASLVEIVIFSWFLSILEKMPMLKGFFTKLYRHLSALFDRFELMVEFLLKPFKHNLRHLANKIERWINCIIGIHAMPPYQQLLIKRTQNPSPYQRLRATRKRNYITRSYTPIIKEIAQKRLQNSNKE